MLITIEEIKAEVRNIRKLAKTDHEAAYGDEVNLYRQVLLAISTGEVAPVFTMEMALQALKAAKLKFPRHTA